MPATPAQSRLAFGLYEADLQSEELWKAGFRIKLQSQPFKVLAALLQRPGKVVTREELQLKLWGKDTVVDFDHSLGTAINKVREALGDSAENPRFIETLSRRGYRFIAPVGPAVTDAEVSSQAVIAATELHDTTVLRSAPAWPPEPLTAVEIAKAAVAADVSQGRVAAFPLYRAGPRRYSLWALVALAIVAVGVASFLVGSSRSTTEPPHIMQITHNGHLAPSVDTMENLAPGVTDGVHLFSPTIESGRTGLSAISLSGGSVVPLTIPSEVASPALGDISPDGSRLLLRDHLSPESEQPLWVVPTIGGSALRVGDIKAHDATWMPDGNGILYANGTNLYLTRLIGNNPELYATLPGRAFWLRWEPNGHLLRFTIIDPIAHTLSLWQISASDHTPKPILTGFDEPAAECCGVWSADGRAFVFQSARGGNTDLWSLAGESTDKPKRLTDGPLRFESPVAARSGNRIFFLGVDARSELDQLGPGGQLSQLNGFLANATRVDYSRDGKWVAWTDDVGALWRARADGTEKLQLTPDNLSVFLAQWSPDGLRLAMMAREPGKAWQIYLIGANGGNAQALLRETRNAADPSWSADGRSLVFGRVNDTMGKENAARTLHILHLDTNQLEEVPGSDGLFSPRWSPDGRYIAALSLDQRMVRLYSVAARTWTTLPIQSGADPVWSSDSRFLYVHASLDAAQPIDRISIPDGRVEQLVRLADSNDKDAVDYVFVGLTGDNRPLIRARVFTGNVYALNLK